MPINNGIASDFVLHLVTASLCALEISLLHAIPYLPNLYYATVSSSILCTLAPSGRRKRPSNDVASVNQWISFRLLSVRFQLIDVPITPDEFAAQETSFFGCQPDREMGRELDCCSRQPSSPLISEAEGRYGRNE